MQALPAHKAAFEAVGVALAAHPLQRLFDPSLLCLVPADCSFIALGDIFEQQGGAWSLQTHGTLFEKVDPGWTTLYYA